MPLLLLLLLALLGGGLARGAMAPPAGPGRPAPGARPVPLTRAGGRAPRTPQRSPPPQQAERQAAPAPGLMPLSRPTAPAVATPPPSRVAAEPREPLAGGLVAPPPAAPVTPEPPVGGGPVLPGQMGKGIIPFTPIATPEEPPGLLKPWSIMELPATPMMPMPALTPVASEGIPIPDWALGEAEFVIATQFPTAFIEVPPAIAPWNIMEAPPAIAPITPSTPPANGGGVGGGGIPIPETALGEAEFVIATQFPIAFTEAPPAIAPWNIMEVPAALAPVALAPVASSGVSGVSGGGIPIPDWALGEAEFVIATQFPGAFVEAPPAMAPIATPVAPAPAASDGVSGGGISVPDWALGEAAFIEAISQPAGGMEAPPGEVVQGSHLGEWDMGHHVLVSIPARLDVNFQRDPRIAFAPISAPPFNPASHTLIERPPALGWFGLREE